MNAPSLVHANSRGKLIRPKWKIVLGKLKVILAWQVNLSQDTTNIKARLLDVTLKPVRAGSHGSNSTRESRLSRVRFNPWEPALTGQIQPVRVSSHGSDSTCESQLSRVGFNPWESALTDQIQSLRIGYHYKFFTKLSLQSKSTQGNFNFSWGWG